ncbi:NAD(P)H-dependent glycerol-3-phosphate dehydrogenase [Calderihabitans maritimus]|uniref:Glycerol-3-phosphate dehydrogenase [NAD(P)+] n=1 Tax=Calderihabitans maritimus TaxID=1246530 RepID=A0A1Z5HUM4_9FIRM|nr:NAD(P)H-dependent glycerol-3-phosphate dehydrogenase [Calderihabitans maritimus]GAW93239.1 glycerol-3-phosphate dehydrogenase [Calderihabitans maritimus]
MRERVAVIGAGSWGTALAIVLAKKGYEVTLWARRQEVVREIETTRINSHYLPEIVIPESIKITADLEETLMQCVAVVLSVPSHAVRETVRRVRPFVTKETVLVNTAKGLEIETLMRLSEVLKQELPVELHNNIAVLSGPSHAEEVSRDLPTAVVAASHRRQVAEYVQDLFMAPNLRVYTNPDVTGVELGGALKNVIALATGISDGLGFGDNTRAALMTRGLAEIARLGTAMGAQSLTFAGLAGIGDLIVTCTSLYSRNRRAGIQLGQGKPLDQVLAGMGMVVEGVRTTKAAYHLAQKYGVEMPITEQTYQVLFEGLNPREAVSKLMLRTRTHEVEEIVVNRQDW